MTDVTIIIDELGFDVANAVYKTSVVDISSSTLFLQTTAPGEYTTNSPTIVTETAIRLQQGEYNLGFTVPEATVFSTSDFNFNRKEGGGNNLGNLTFSKTSDLVETISNFSDTHAQLRKNKDRLSELTDRQQDHVYSVVVSNINNLRLMRTLSKIESYNYRDYTRYRNTK